MTDLELAFNALNDKRARYDFLWGFYLGSQPLIYSREKLREIFADLNANFTENWCSVVVDSAMERIQLRQFTVADDEDTQAALNEIAEENELMLESDPVHLSCLVTGEAFVIAWKEADEEYPQAYYNDSRLCHAFYEAKNPRKMRFAVKCWHDDNGYVRKNLYYADRIEYYQTGKPVKSMADVTTHKYFVSSDPDVAPNPYGAIPVFHFRKERVGIRSELSNIVTAQNGINKLVNDMMIAAEFGAFPQRWAITDNNLDNLKNAPNEIWKLLPAAKGDQSTQLGEFSTAKLDGYLAAIDKFATFIAISTRTPKHYFFGQGGDPSGEALIAMESPLNKKCQKYIDRFSATWKQLARFMLKMQDVDIKASAVAAVFDKPETVQPYTEALIRKTNVEAGVPLVSTLRDDGWQDSEIDKMLEDRGLEQKAAQDAAGFNNPNEMSATIQAAHRVLQNGGG